MLCYNDKAYKLDKKDDYFTKWTRASGITKCECNGIRSTGNDSELLTALTSAVRYLNEVDLSKYPGKCNGSGVPTTTCNGTDSSCTYPVHKYQNKDVTVRVECKKIGMDGSTSSSSSVGSDSDCHYKKMIHTHNGISGGTGGAKGFRLGSVKYKGINQGQVRYAAGNNRWYPLVSVTTYFYSEDKNYASPLLVVLEFQKNREQQTAKVKEYYKLNKFGTSSLQWNMDPRAAGQIGDGDNKKLIAYLDNLRYGIQKVVQIEIQNHSGSYKLKGGTGGQDLSRYRALNGTKKIHVNECTDCTQLKDTMYKCFQHDLTGRESGMDYNEIGGLRFTVPGEKGKGDIEIPLYENGTKIPQIEYNKCMGDVFVYFYDSRGAGVGSDVDKVPLMLHFNNKWYKPENRDEYFSKWVTVPGLDGVTKPCVNGDATTLVNKLNEVNRALNQIDLDHDKVKSLQSGSGSGSYGLPEDVDGVKVNTQSFKTERVALTKQDGPSKPPNTPAYTRIVHRTVNGFQIGDIKYKGQDFAEKGVSINGTQGGGAAEIKVKNGSTSTKTHKNLVKTHNWNTVVAYYSYSDNNFQLPQLIVILKTSEEVSKSETVKGNASDKSYGYYILTNKSGGSPGAGSAANGVSKDYEYVWHPVTNGNNVTLDDATDFKLLNSVVILIEQRPNNGSGTGSYNDEKIKQAITSAKLKSPGQQSGQINRITGKTINVKDVTSGTCLNETGFKLITHDISELVTPNGKLKSALSNVSLIAGLRFLIPTRDSADKYRQLNLYNYSFVELTQKRYLYYNNCNGNVYVYFYGDDPRPLMLCYNSVAYGAKNMGEYDSQQWTKDGNVNKCDCPASECNNCKLLKALVEVSDFLNPVQINKTNGDKNNTSYEVHKFNGQDIKIKVESVEATEKFCYHRYTHTHHGIGSGGAGFRLGNIKYDKECIKVSNGGTNGCITSELKNGGSSKKHESADKVVVFYYQGDTGFKRPLLVALCENGKLDKCNLYYELQNDGASSGVKKYKKGNNGSINVDETTSGGPLEKKLDGIRYDIAIKLQIIIDKLPMETLYCFKCEKNGQTADCNNDTKGIKCYKAGEARNQLQCEIKKKENGKNSTPMLQCKIKENLKKNDNNNPDYVLLSAGKSVCYKAQLYESNNIQTPNGPTTTSETTTPTTTKDVKVAPVDCPELSRHGYRCYEHKVQGVDGVDQIGGLKFFLWDNTSQGGGFRYFLPAIYILYHFHPFPKYHQ